VALTGFGNPDTSETEARRTMTLAGRPSTANGQLSQPRRNRRGFFMGRRLWTTPPINCARSLCVRHNLPARLDPERFHIKKSEIERTLVRIAAKLEGQEDRRAREKPHRTVVTTEVIAGRKVIVQRPRMPFAIFVGGKA
jgi:hypothetical protein